MPGTTVTSASDDSGEPKKFRTINAGEEFDYQPTPSRFLPDPRIFVLNVTHRALEVLAGSRDLSQIARWVTKDVYDSLDEKVNQRIRKLSLLPPAHRNPPAPVFNLSGPRLSAPRDGVVEGTVIVRSPHRVRAVALRIEGLDHRWRAASFTLI
jgi:hypothetical protein